jgi:hypothetical protein
MLGQSGKLRIRACASQDLSVAHSHRAPAFALKCSGDDSGATASHASINEVVYELDEIVRQANGDLLAHTIMVPNWYLECKRMFAPGSFISAGSLNPNAHLGRRPPPGPCPTGDKRATLT